MKFTCQALQSYNLNLSHLKQSRRPYSPLSLLNSRAFPTELHVILGTALSVSNQWWGSGTIMAKSSWKLSLFVSLTPIITLSRPHSARCTPEKKLNTAIKSHVDLITHKKPICLEESHLWLINKGINFIN